MSRDSDEDPSDDDYPPGPSTEFYNDEDLDVDISLGTLLSTLRLEESRRREPSQEDDEALRRIHERLLSTIHREQDDARRRRLKKALPHSNCLREQVFYLRRCFAHSALSPAPSYFPRLTTSLSAIVTGSFDEEYRKIAILLGMVDALAEVLVLEVSVFGGMPGSSPAEHRSVRKLIANALTNLTFGHIKSKKRLCNYSEFMPTVVRIIEEARNLSQVYSGLIRNLSWLADGEMAAVLSSTVQVLSTAAIESQQQNDEGCLRASLSALWNLASHSMENKKIICDQPECLLLLAQLLRQEASQSSIVESASGILKYATQYLSSTSTHLQERQVLVEALLQLLTSGSFTTLCNALNALANLIAKDPHLQARISSNACAMDKLKTLLVSNKDDTRNAAKAVVNHLSQPYGYPGRYNEMSTSMGIGFDGARDAGRLLPQRHMRISPGAAAMMASPAHHMSPQFVAGPRCSSLPRHFARGGAFSAASNHSSPHHMMPPGPVGLATPNMNCFAPPINPMGINPLMHNMENEEDADDTHFEMDEMDTVSARCDRSNASRDSLESDLLNFSGITSNVDTVNHSRLSPVSPSDLPSSPTHYTYEKMRQEAAEKALRANLDPMATLSLKSSDSLDLHSDTERTTSSDAATAVAEDFDTPTYPNPQRIQEREGSESPELPGPIMENDYATVEATGDLLQRSIEAALPRVSPGRYRTESQAKDAFLADMIEKSMPSRSPMKTPRSNSNTQAESDRLLMQCIKSAMPSPGGLSGSLSKNEQGGRDRQVTEPDRPLHGHRGSIQQQRSVDSSDGSDVSFGLDWKSEEIDTSIPIDCLMEEMTIDCSVASTARGASAKVRTTATNARIFTNGPQKSSLPRPTSRLKSPTKSQVTPVKPRTPRTAQVQAVVPPYNYQKPKPKEEKEAEKKKPVISSNTMLVTTV